MNDKLIGFTVAVFFHGALFAVGTAAFIKEPSYGIETGTSGIEVNLVAAPIEAKSVEEVKEIKPVEPENIPQLKAQVQTPLPPIAPEIKSSGKDNINFHSAGGAISEAKPDYLTNPPPPYPFKARQNGWEGLVSLKVSVGKSGSCLEVEIEKSSGHAILDEAAVKAVKTWKFHPAQLGNMPIESIVRVPVRFYLDDLK